MSHFKRHWVCLAEKEEGPQHDGPCPLVPAWWNWTRFARRVRRGSR